MSGGGGFTPDPSWPSILELATKLWGEPTDWSHDRNEVRFGAHQSKSIKIKELVWFDNEANEGGGYVEIHKKAIGPLPPRPNGKPNGTANGHGERLKPWENVGTVYHYHDPDGGLVLDVIRSIDGRPRFYQRRPNGYSARGDTKWKWSVRDLPGHDCQLYRLPGVLASGDTTIFVCEGEKDVDNLTKLGLVATCNIGGAGKWRAEYTRYFLRKHVVVLVDNDKAGEDHAATVARSLHPVVASLKVLMLPGLLDKGDVSDWLADGGTRDELEWHAREAPPYVPPAEPEPVEEEGPSGPPEPPPPEGDPGPGNEPPLADLFVLKANLPHVSQQVRDHLAAHPWIFERGSPARVVTFPPEDNRPPEIDVFGIDGVVHATHDVCRPYEVSARGTRKNITLPDRVASLYLALKGRWKLRVLKGICGSVLLDHEGGIHAIEGYHEASGLWCSRPPALDVPERPFRDQAVDALYRLRMAQRTFTFKGSPLTRIDGIDADVVDIDRSPSLSESAALCGLLTAVCRPSLPLAPGVMVNAPSVSGSGAGKGLWARMVVAIAYGLIAKASTAGHDEQELEKRIGASLLRGEAVLLLDNLNNTQLRSPQLESCLTEGLVSVRLFGVLKMQDVHCNAFVVVTGNGLQASADSARRFIYPTIEPPLDNPGERLYPPGFLAGIFARRSELLSDCLTIWRWGRQQTDLKRGMPVGSYEQWAEWVRDPLLALGCTDPIKGAAEARALDPARVNLTAMLTEWRTWHQAGWVKADDLNYQVRRLIDDRERTAAIRQKLAPLVNTRIGGFMLESQITGNKAHQVTEYRVVILPDSP